MSIPRAVVIVTFFISAVVAFGFPQLIASIPGTLPPHINVIRGSLGIGSLVITIFGMWFSQLFPESKYSRVTKLDEVLAVVTFLLALRALFLSIPYFGVILFFLVALLLYGAFERSFPHVTKWFMNKLIDRCSE